MAVMTPKQVFGTPRRHQGPVAFGPADAEYRAFELLYAVFTALPLAAGLGKWFGFLADWPALLAPPVREAAGRGAHNLLLGLGVLEIALALLVAFNPKAGGVAASIWLMAGILDLLLLPGRYGLAACLGGLAVCAMAMSLLAAAFEVRRDGRSPN